MATAVIKRRKPSRRARRIGKGLTFEKVWASLQEVAEMQKKTDRIIKKNAEEREKRRKEEDERRKEEDKMHKKSAEEREKRLKEEDEQRKKRAEEHEKWRIEMEQLIKENERIVRRNGKQMGELHRRFGQLAEHLVAPGIAKRFNELGYHFSLMSPKGQKVFDENGKIKTEIDLLLENGRTIMAVEVKIKPVIQDVEHHIKRLEIIRDHRYTLNDRRKIQGAIAGAIFEDDVKKAVREAGLFVIEQSGDTMKIDMPEGFTPREW